MQNIIQVNSIQQLAEYGIHDAVIAVGTFDGLHAGHREVMTELVNSAGKYCAVPVAVTFSPHPRAVLCPDSVPELLIPETVRIQMFAALGCHAAAVIPFTKELAQLSPDAFLDRILFCPGVRIHAVCVGSHWRFGANALGNATLLAKRAVRDGFAFYPVPELLLPDGQPISSTCIRGLIQRGNIRRARELLGYSPMISGPVVHGNRVASTQLQCATANIDVTDGVLPADGVYCGRAKLSGQPGNRYAVVVNIGLAPTFQVGERRVEAHLLDCDVADFYGENLTIEFAERLRDERKFPDATSLMMQIMQDIEFTKQLLNHGMKS